MQAHPATFLGRVVPVGARDDRLTNYLAGTGDSAVQIGVCPEFLDHVDLHLDTEAAELEMLGPDADDELSTPIR